MEYMLCGYIQGDVATAGWGPGVPISSVCGGTALETVPG